MVQRQFKRKRDTHFEKKEMMKKECDSNSMPFTVLYGPINKFFILLYTL